MSADPRPSNVEIAERLEKRAAEEEAFVAHAEANRDDWFCTMPVSVSEAALARAALDRLAARALCEAEDVILALLTVEPQDRGHVHTIGVQHRAREFLGIGDRPIGAVQAERARQARGGQP